MLAGQQLASGLFGSMLPNIGPSPEEMEAERQRVLYQKHVRVQKHHVRIFDMHNKKDVGQYEELMKKLIQGVQAKTHVIWDNDRELLTRDGKQGWQRYLEWSEFVLEQTPTPPVGVK